MLHRFDVREVCQLPVPSLVEALTLLDGQRGERVLGERRETGPIYLDDEVAWDPWIGHDIGYVSWTVMVLPNGSYPTPATCHMPATLLDGFGGQRLRLPKHRSSETTSVSLPPYIVVVGAEGGHRRRRATYAAGVVWCREREKRRCPLGRHLGTSTNADTRSGDS